MSCLKRSSVSLFVVLFVLCCAGAVFAQVVTPRPSQMASVMQRIGVTDVTITYSRPGVKGRQIWGDPPAGWAETAKGEATLTIKTRDLRTFRSYRTATCGAPARTKRPRSSFPMTY